MDDLERTARLYQRRRSATEEAYADLLPLIHEARRSGATLRAIAAKTGLSFARIYQIVKGRTQDAST